jgi:hypothetical protein
MRAIAVAYDDGCRAIRSTMSQTTIPTSAAASRNSRALTVTSAAFTPPETDAAAGISRRPAPDSQRYPIHGY